MTPPEMEHGRTTVARAVSNSWLAIQRTVDNPRLRLFCLPYAGGGAAVYRRWPEDLPGDVEIVALQLPGRERRIAERPCTDMTEVVSEVCHAIAPLLDRPFALFGHSMGAIIVFETARRLSASHGLQPMRLFVSGRRAPHLPARKAPIHHLPHDEFLAEIRELKGTPAEVLANADLMELMTPMLRADFRMIETYRHAPAQPLACDLIAFGGETDDEVNRDEVAAWRSATSGRFRMEMLPGDHFFLNSQRARLMPLLSEELAAI
jgi:medium-chain acyl-[acyl-carrier-protein] hydrolase